MSLKDQDLGSKIYVMATPIGNLEDLSARAIRILKEVDILAAEDTRHVRKLLAKFEITVPHIESYYDHVEEVKALQLVNRLKEQNLTLAIVSDAGTPCIADPGYRLISLARQNNIPVIPIPGPCAITTLLSASGVPSGRFYFAGFLPTKTGVLKDEVKSWNARCETIVCYESMKRLHKSLKVVAACYPTSTVVIGRELTKMNEEIITLPIQEAVSYVEQSMVIKGEVSLIFYLPKAETSVDLEDLQAEISRFVAQDFSHKDIMEKLSSYEIEKKKLYRLILEEQKRVAEDS